MRVAMVCRSPICSVPSAVFSLSDGGTASQFFAALPLPDTVLPRCWGLQEVVGGPVVCGNRCTIVELKMGAAERLLTWCAGRTDLEHVHPPGAVFANENEPGRLTVRCGAARQPDLEPLGVVEAIRKLALDRRDEAAVVLQNGLVSVPAGPPRRRHHRAKLDAARAPAAPPHRAEKCSVFPSLHTVRVVHSVHLVHSVHC